MGPAGPAFAAVACDRRGTHSLQALVARAEGSPDSEFRAIAACLTPSTPQPLVTTGLVVGSLALDQHGTHVVQQVVEVVGSRSALADAIFEEVVDNFKSLATSQYGLGLVKRCIGYAEVRGYGIRLAAKLEQHLGSLVEDAYGNYAVQHALEVWGSAGSVSGTSLGTLPGPGRPESSCYASAKRMVQRISERVVAYAQHKFASNVAEMAIKIAEPQMRWKLISQFTVVRGEEGEFFGSLLRSPFAVFVVATALKNANDQKQARRLAEKFAQYLGGRASAGLPPKTKAKWLKTLTPYVGVGLGEGVNVPAEIEGRWFVPPGVGEVSISSYSEASSSLACSFYY